MPSPLELMMNTMNQDNKKTGMTCQIKRKLPDGSLVDADARGSEAIYKDGEVVGRATSGGYGWRCEKSLALGLVRLELATLGTELEIEILGERYKAIVIEESPFDSTNECLRS